MTAAVDYLAIDRAILTCAARAARENRAPWDIAAEEYAKARVLGDTDTADAYRAAGRYYTEGEAP